MAGTMQIERIRAQIEEGKEIERRTGVLRRAVVDLVTRDGVRISDGDVTRIVSFVTRYIEHAPVLMAAIEDSAARNGTLEFIRPILDATAQYFHAADDIIPDNFGLVGLLDDSYLAHSLMEKISDRYKLQSGRSLVPVEAHGLNKFVRRLIGVPFVEVLDAQVSATMDSLSIDADINQFLAAFGEIDLVSAPDPLWGTLAASDVSFLRIMATGRSAT